MLAGDRADCWSTAATAYDENASIVSRSADKAVAEIKLPASPTLSSALHSLHSYSSTHSRPGPAFCPRCRLPKQILHKSSMVVTGLLAARAPNAALLAIHFGLLPPYLQS